MLLDEKNGSPIGFGFPSILYLLCIGLPIKSLSEKAVGTSAFSSLVSVFFRPSMLHVRFEAEFVSKGRVFQFIRPLLVFSQNPSPSTKADAIVGEC